ncbi:MAG: tetratricopeptide repeat protein [Deltaproteobacteria bacterium]|nr:tetratricopeptide repeat protein [Deltaproteobacteria bacterium]
MTIFHKLNSMVRKPGIQASLPLLFLALVVVLLPGCKSTEDVKVNNKSADLYFGEGSVHLSDGNVPFALENFSKAVELEPDNPRYNNYLGLAYLFLMKVTPDRNTYPQAVKHIKKAIELDPKYTDAKLNLGAVYLDMEDWDKAIVTFKIVLEDIFYNKHGKAYTNLGWAYYNKGLNEMALKNLRTALKINPNNALAYNYMGLTLLKTNKLKGAVAAHEKAVKLRPSSVEYNYNLAVALSKNKDRDGAIEVFEKVIKLNPTSEKASRARDYIKLLK